DGKAQSGIRTLHRTGYRFVGEVEESDGSAVRTATSPADVQVAVAAHAPSAAVATREPDAQVATRGPSAPVAAPLTRGRVGIVGAAPGPVAPLGALAMLPRAGRNIDAPAAVAASAAAPTTRAPAHGAKTLAVLPFRNLSADPEQDYFADGIGVEILIALSRL